MLEILLVRGKLISQIKIMEKGVALVTHIYKACVQARHELFHLGYVDIANRKGGRARLTLILYEVLIF